MGTSLDVSPLAYQVSTFLSDGLPRFIVQKRDTLIPSKALSIYENHLNHKFTSPNSIKSNLNLNLYIFTWAKSVNLNIEDIILRGELLSAFQIRHFAYWLSCRGSVKTDGIEVISIDMYNKVLMCSSNLISWFARIYRIDIDALLNPSERAIAINGLKELFNAQKKKDRRVRFAPDLTDDEISAIERFLQPENRLDTSPEIAKRDYLVWRIAIEFGMRIGEILALRLCDCPHQGQDYFKIVRIEERGTDYRDPRGANAPRPKTLSRDLGFLLKNSKVHESLNDYTTAHRYAVTTRHGKKMQQFMLTHQFLVISHCRGGGTPLSRSGIQRVAKLISMGTGINFHWHLPRHAFFNKAYAAITDLPEGKERKAKLMDLVEWGGWSDEKSLKLYAKRTLRDRAQKALMIWQKGKNIWDALG